MSDDSSPESETPPPSYDDFIKDEYPNGYPYHKLCQNQESRLLYFSVVNFQKFSKTSVTSVEFLIRKNIEFLDPKSLSVSYSRIQPCNSCTTDRVDPAR